MIAIADVDETPAIHGSRTQPTALPARLSIMSQMPPLIVLLVGVALLTGCASVSGPTMADCVAGFHHPPGDTSRCIPARLPTPAATVRTH